jgi:hypothetical protein
VHFSPDFDKFYQVREMLNHLTPDLVADVMGMRTISPIGGLGSSFKDLRVLHHPYLFNSFGKPSSDQADEVRALLEADRLEELQFEMRYSGADY